jgi:uncharacterized protein YgiM (DUF1202 family)
MTDRRNCELDVVSPIERVVSRRMFNRFLLGAGLTALAIGFGVGPIERALAEETGFYRTTSSVNLRVGPSRQRSILHVIPANAMVTSLGASKNGFKKVSYLGKAGWVYGDYLTVTNGGSSDEPSMPVGFAVTNDSVNFRAEPSTSARVIRVLPAHTTVELFDAWQSGFRKAGFAQESGWIHESYLDETDAPEGYLTTTSALNLRSQPKTSAKVIVVMPKGSAVRATDELSNGFRRVNFQGTNGWAHDDYLK